MIKNYALSIVLLLIFCVPVHMVRAQTLVPDTETIATAKVHTAGASETEPVPATGVSAQTQELTVEIMSGAEKGKVVTFENDFTQLREGDTFYLKHISSVTDGKDYYSVADPYRLNILLMLLGLFVVLTVLIGGKQGIRGLLSLVGSFLVIWYVLLPGIVAGYPPALVAVGAASVIILIGSYITHGVNRTTTSAVLGMIVTICITGLLAWGSVALAHLSGYTSDEATYVHFQYGGTIDLVGLLLGGILIGLLGVLYDSAIGQAVAVEELMRISKEASTKTIFLRAMRMGREHIGALVNTLAIAYVGAGLPLLLLFEGTSAPLGYLINAEVLSTEILRILVGSIGLILAVPITTLISVYILSTYGVPKTAHHSHHH